MTNTKELKQRILDATEIAIEELIKVLQDPIIMLSDDERDGVLLEKPSVTAEKMKVAAQAKRIAFDDALYLTEQLESQRNLLDESEENKDVSDTTNFAERFTKKDK